MTINSGLEGIIAAETVLSEVDGDAGRLVLRGHRLQDIAGKRSLEWLIGTLWAGFVDADLSEAAIRRDLGKARVAAFASIAPLLPAATRLAPIEALRLLLAAVPDAAPHDDGRPGDTPSGDTPSGAPPSSNAPMADAAAGDASPGNAAALPLRLTATMAVGLAAVLRSRAGATPLPPDPALGHAADFLRMLRASTPAAKEVTALETYLLTATDHGLNASTFTARVVASTRAGLASSVTAALCALKGPLHGGAPGPVIDMLDAIGTPENAEAWLDAAVQNGDRLMGFGHRVYRVTDPRSDVVKRAVSSLGRNSGRVRFAEHIEQAALAVLARRKPARSLQTNLEFYTALLLEALDVPRDAFTGVFATARVIGWIAHAHEQVAEQRLIRPQSRYVGPLPLAA